MSIDLCNLEQERQRISSLELREVDGERVGEELDQLHEEAKEILKKCRFCGHSEVTNESYQELAEQLNLRIYSCGTTSRLGYNDMWDIFTYEQSGCCKELIDLRASRIASNNA